MSTAKGCSFLLLLSRHCDILLSSRQLGTRKLVGRWSDVTPRHCHLKAARMQNKSFEWNIRTTLGKSFGAAFFCRNPKCRTKKCRNQKLSISKRRHQYFPYPNLNWPNLKLLGYHQITESGYRVGFEWSRQYQNYFDIFSFDILGAAPNLSISAMILKTSRIVKKLEHSLSEYFANCTSEQQKLGRFKQI
jgi:hypothetical protein